MRPSMKAPPKSAPAIGAKAWRYAVFVCNKRPYIAPPYDLARAMMDYYGVFAPNELSSGEEAPLRELMALTQAEQKMVVEIGMEYRRHPQLHRVSLMEGITQCALRLGISI